MIVLDEKGEKHLYHMGSYFMMNPQKETVSYASPMGKLLQGARVGEKKEGDIGGVRRIFTVMEIF